MTQPGMFTLTSEAGVGWSPAVLTSNLQHIRVPARASSTRWQTRAQPRTTAPTAHRTFKTLSRLIKFSFVSASLVQTQASRAAKCHTRAGDRTCCAASAKGLWPTGVIVAEGIITPHIQNRRMHATCTAENGTAMGDVALPNVCKVANGWHEGPHANVPGGRARSKCVPRCKI
jgi:hypothetical protein